MSTNPIGGIGVGPLTRAQRAAAGGVDPTPLSTGAPPPTVGAAPVLTPLSFPLASQEFGYSEPEEKSHRHDSQATESDMDLDEETRLQMQEDAMNQRIHQLQLTAIKQRLTIKARQLDALEAEAETHRRIIAGVQAAPSLPAGAPVVPTAAEVATPARFNLRPRMLAFQSTIGRKPPTAAALQYQAGVDGLPNRGTSVSLLDKAKEVEPPDEVQSVRRIVTGESRSKSAVKPVQPVMFTGDDATQNERVDSWVRAVDSWLKLGQIPADQHLEYARSLFSTSGTACLWLGQKDDELEASDKDMTWDWLRTQVIQHYGSPSGALAMASEWQVLRMGVKNVDGSETGGKSTWTVMAYTALFLRYMRGLTSHSVQTNDVLVIDRYVAGIKSGYEALYKVMLGVQKVLWFDTLKEAIDAAEIAEVTLTVSRIDKKAERSSSSSASSSGRNYRGGGPSRRPPTDSLNSVEGTTTTGEEGDEKGSASAAPSEPMRVFGFRYHGPGPTDGRHPLTESQARMLYEERRCYRCYKVHPLGPGTPRCSNPPATTAPKPLK